MKKKFLVALVLSLVSAAAFAGNYGMAGCGLGSMIIKDDGFVQVFAATTNGTSGSQTFGITTGTSNCTKDGAVKSEREKEAFVESAMAELTKDISKGEGEYLTTLASLYGCDRSATSKFSITLKANFEEISKANDAQSMLSTIDRTVASDAELSKSCNNH
ncbi:MAG: DUF3015 family protein [Myxococcota bacterium]